MSRLDINPYKVNPSKQKPMSSNEYRRHLISVAHKLKEGNTITTREAALFFGKTTINLIQNVFRDTRKYYPTKTYNRYHLSLEDIVYLMENTKAHGGRINVYTLKPMAHPSSFKPIKEAYNVLISA